MHSADELRRRRAAARARVRRRRRLASAVLVLALAAGIGTALGISSGSSRHRAGSRGVTATRRARSRPVVITVEASGDLLIHSPVWERALALGGGTHYDFAPLFAQIRPILRNVDLPLCHVETPMTPTPPTGYPTFNTPPELATAIRQTGFRVCSTAATHTLDEGQTGIDDTNRYLDRAGILHAGAYSSATAQQQPLLFTVKGVRVAFLSYTDITNGIPSPHRWSVNRASAAAILAEAHHARELGARVVIVNIHWGDEYVNRPAAFQLQLADTLTRSPDITAIVGQHAHVVQPIRKINGKWVVFGEGNLISNQTEACCVASSQDGLIAILRIRVDGRGARVTSVRYVPIWVQHPTYLVLQVGTGLRTDPADAVALRASYERTVAAVGRGPGLEPIPPRLR